ncbi:class III chitinase ChiA2 [Metarhizium rileyi]|uniref:Class III chitinase ChiA2 n=1 Tax=Metarhizium rileyi (strain RCEF 4871) TaxID=1649241 RepID=A0A166YF23_METRR|nr:class III chitinase ChiA2 [Metarhizium rileyi RCEF 4871]
MPFLFNIKTTASLGLLASTSLAAPHQPAFRARDTQNVVYWGQNGGGIVENNDLATYCTKEAGIDVLVLSFLYQYGNGKTMASGTIGQSCFIASSGEAQNCDDLASAIDTCKTNGVKIILSLGGAVGSYALSSREEAEAIGQRLWDAYGKPGNNNNNNNNININNETATPRPFGKTFVNGWDFDIESNMGNRFYEYMIARLRSNFASDPDNRYLITGAPQCPVPEPNMNEIITRAQFDYLWVQFYNNPGCSVDGTINFDDWKRNLANTPSSRAKIFIGVPASPAAATGTPSGARYYLEPARLAALVARHSRDVVFGGLMMWSAGYSDANRNNGCTYAQQARRILTTGRTC